jgi:hypothetical protein
MALPGALGERLSAAQQQKGGLRIPHLEILRALQNPAQGIANIVDTYCRRVLPIKTRTIQLLGRKAPARIIETLLGYEVKAHYKRIQCPDMVTARYVKLFTELGCRSIRLPYDPTVTAELIPGLEQAVKKISDAARDLFPNDHGLQLYVIRCLFSRLRSQLKAGAKNMA